MQMIDNAELKEIAINVETKIENAMDGIRIEKN